MQSVKRYPLVRYKLWKWKFKVKTIKQQEKFAFVTSCVLPIGRDIVATLALLLAT